MKVRTSKVKEPVPLPAELCVVDLPTSLSDVSAAETTATTGSVSPSKSLGFGSLNQSGQVSSFTLSPTRQHQKTQQLPPSKSPKRRTTALEKPSFSSPAKFLLERIEKASPVVFKRALSSFIRVADLDMDTSTTVMSSSVSDVESEESFPNFHRASVDPPPGHEHDDNELWVCLDNGEGEHAPIAPAAVAALAKSGLFTTFDQSMWVPEGKTAKFIQRPENAWHACTWNRDGPVQLPGPSSQEVLVWSGKFTHGRYGSDLPAVRSAALIGMSPEALMDLLVDSNRVKEYNAMSLGREDLLVLQEDLEGGAFGGITKVMRSETRPPMVRKTLSFTSILHVRKLPDGSGFKLVSRAVTSPVDNSLAGTLQSEILLSVNIIKRVQDQPNQCLMVAVNHIRSPMVPMMIAKRIGLAAAVNFINDVRACC